jgi:hypothetical protein
MDGILRRRWRLLLGGALSLGLLAGLLSFAPFDPTLTNLRYPMHGVANWLGYPGALLLGSLVEALGAAALGLPVLVFNRLAGAAGRISPARYGGHGAALLLAWAALLGLGDGPPGLGLRGPGLVGWAAGRWMRDTVGVWPAALLLLFAAAYAGRRLVTAPAVEARLRDARTLAGFWAGQARAWLAGHGRRAGGMLPSRPGGAGTDAPGWSLREALLLPVLLLWALPPWLWRRGVRAGLVGRLRRAAAAWRNRRRSVAWVKRSADAPLLAAGGAEAGNRFRPAPAAGDGFAAWLEPEGAAPPLAGAAPQAAPQARPRDLPEPSADPAARIERWEEHLRRYRENLDLDWDERSWQNQRPRAEEAERPGAAKPPKPRPSTE